MTSGIRLPTQRSSVVFRFLRPSLLLLGSVPVPEGPEKETEYLEEGHAVIKVSWRYTRFSPVSNLSFKVVLDLC